MGKPGKTSPKMLEAREKALKALELRKAGIPYAKIAQTLEYADESGARKAVSRLIQRNTMEATDEYRKLAIERLDEMLFAIWKAVKQGHLGAIDRALRIEERRAKLVGLDAPARIDIEARIREAALAAGIDPDEAVAEANRILHASRRATFTD